MTALILLLSTCALVAYACRFDHLTWRNAPAQMLAHVAGGAAAAWPFTGALSGEADARMVVAVLASLLWLVVSFKRFGWQAL